VIAAHPEITRWAVGGHSLGGAMSAAYIYGNPAAIGGLALWAAYPAGNNSLADRATVVTSISATNDGLATADKIEASRPLLPPDTTWVVIEGGNHAGFGYYGRQGGDGQATLPRKEQQRQTVDATVQMLRSLP
jgi:hypothetical protein